MKIKTKNLNGAALEWAVQSIGNFYILDIEVRQGNPLYFPAGNELGEYYEQLWLAGKMHGQTKDIAAMRYFVWVNLGDEVDIPDVLCK